MSQQTTYKKQYQEPSQAESRSAEFLEMLWHKEGFNMNSMIEQRSHKLVRVREIVRKSSQVASGFAKVRADESGIRKSGLSINVWLSIFEWTHEKVSSIAKVPRQG